MTRVIAGTAGGRRLSVPAGRDTRPTSDRAREGLFATVQAIRGPLAGASVLDLYAGSGAVGLEALSRGAVRAVLVEADPRAVRVIRANIAALNLPGAHVIAGRVEPVLAKGPAAAVGRTLAPGDPEAVPGAAAVGRTPAPGDPKAVPGAAAVGRTPAPGDPEAVPGDSDPGPAPGPEAVAGARFDVVFADPPYAMAADAVTAVLTALVQGGWLAPGALVAVERSTRSGPLHWPGGYTEDRSRRYGEATLWYGHASGAAD
jgi:16S rRNA (guanine966-N2)-methyltransferase